jgi:hypothetical protein
VKIYNKTYIFSVKITVLWHNENCNRPVAKTQTGEDRYRVVRSKAHRQAPTIQYDRVPATYGWYTARGLSCIFLSYFRSKFSINNIPTGAAVEYRDELFSKLERFLLTTKPGAPPDAPPTLAASGEQIDRAELKARQESRPGILTKRHVPEPTPEENRKR